MAEELAIRCRSCGWTLGVLICGVYVIRFHGREWMGQVQRIRCERCTTIWQPDTLAGTAVP